MGQTMEAAAGALLTELPARQIHSIVSLVDYSYQRRTLGLNARAKVLAGAEPAERASWPRISPVAVSSITMPESPDAARYFLPGLKAWVPW